MLSFIILVILVVLINKVLTRQSNTIPEDSYSTANSKSNSHSNSNMVAVIKTKEEFTKATAAANLVVVDFFATWCGPCKMIAPLLEKFSKEYTSADFYKVDVDELPEVAAANEVSAMPTILLFKSGELVGKVIGANPAAIKQALAKFA